MSEETEAGAGGHDCGDRLKRREKSGEVVEVVWEYLGVSKYVYYWELSAYAIWGVGEASMAGRSYV